MERGELQSNPKMGTRYWGTQERAGGSGDGPSAESPMSLMGDEQPGEPGRANNWK